MEDKKLTPSAQPFKPGGGSGSGSGQGQSQTSQVSAAAATSLSSTFNSINLNAKPFVPPGAAQAAGTGSFKNVNAVPFMPGRRQEVVLSVEQQQQQQQSTTQAHVQPALGTQDLPLLPDELDPTEDDVVGMGLGEDPSLFDPAAVSGEGPYPYHEEEEEDEEGYGIDAVVRRLTHADPTKPVQPGHSKVASQFMAEQLSQYLAKSQQLVFAHVPSKNQFGIPDYIHVYHSLLPLEDITRMRPSQALQISTKVFKGVSSSDGFPYALWRLSEAQVPATREAFQRAKEVVKKWQVVSSFPHIVGFRDAFLSNEFGGAAALYLVYDFHPKAATVEKVYIRTSSRTPVPEDVMWSFAIQLANLLLVVHSHGLALGSSLKPSKLLITNKIRLRANVVGVQDLVQREQRQTIQDQQAEDVWRAGQMLLMMACRQGGGANLELVRRNYSEELAQLLQNLLTIQKGVLPNGKYFARLMGEHAFTELSNVNVLNDMLYENLYKELQNGRLVRLLVKLGMVNERPDDSTSMQWADSGDRYLLKLFRDFVFHQKTEDGRPNLDFGHVVESLNKLDAGVREQMMLLSRDEKSVLVVSYKDMKQAIVSAYDELQSRSSAKRW